MESLCHGKSIFDDLKYISFLNLYIASISHFFMSKVNMGKIISIADKILQTLNKAEDLKISKLVDITGFSEEEVTETISYLVKKGWVRNTKIFIISLNSPQPIPPFEYDITTMGQEIVALGLPVKKIIESELRGTFQVQQNTHVKGDYAQIAQTGGDNSSISQSQDNSQIITFNKLIDEDPELKEAQKIELKSIAEKIVQLKNAGETTEKIYCWIGKGIEVCAKYGSHLVRLLHVY